MATATVAHCYYCFDVLTAKLEGRPPHSLAKIEALLAAQKLSQASGHSGLTNGHADLTNGNSVHANGHSQTNGTAAHPQPTKQAETPLFVTWKKSSSSSADHRLRGCIGTFDAKPLNSGLKDYALTAALHDTRFEPISRSELSRLECGVTLLTDFEPAKDAMDWTLGKHGLQIDFVYHHRRMGATYLPDVPVEQGWTQEETLVSLMRKAGWTGRKDEWRKIPLKVTRYRGSNATAKWAGYRKLVGDGAEDDDDERDDDDDDMDEDEEDEEEDE